MDVLKERALQFYEEARFAIEREFCELALFNVEQTLQLYIKHLLYKKVGDFPKTHFLRDLADRLVEVYGDRCGLAPLFTKWRYVLALLEYAYISSRYLPFRARREDCQEALKFAEEALAVFKCLESL
ncbi:MAG: HEPN domain-containing protein [Pyrobaculum sp.]|uniref:HEPN domain-containing protein n=1 Tax=unclassified Pyrobaculum TaxID=2643434 RepID=UPI0021D8CBA0|nr:HEPN domain-containing protein [Pyrobaculum sp. 3827-6]MCU7788465.1 HEPN domain-containing protein [Pyrobaculum sp. 3827-6]